MKKVFISIISFTSSIIVFAQDSTPKIPSLTQQSLDDKMDQAIINSSSNSIESVVPLIAISLVITLVIRVIRSILDHKLKNRIIDRNISEQLANTILGKNEDDKKVDAIKWAFLLFGLGGGLTVSYYTMPFNIHSLAIMAFSIGISYLAYYFFLTYSKK